MQHRAFKKVTSVQNPLVKHLVQLRKSRSYREKEKKALVMGECVIRELSKFLKPLNVCSLQFTDLDAYERHEVTKSILKKITGLPSPPEMVAEFPLPQPSPMMTKGRLLACDGVRDPGNLGTLIRSALAWGWEGVLLLNDSVDPFNDKVIRASRGGSFLLPYFQGDLNDLKKMKEHKILIADLEGKKISDVKAEKKMILLLGNEGEGLSLEAVSLGEKITIPMSEKTESLNVAVAGSLLMYLLSK